VASRHIFVCTNGRASGKPACGPRGGDAVVAAVQHELLARGAIEVLVTTCGCLGPCFDGPNAVVYPDGVWYGALAPSDAAALADHLIDGRLLAAKVSQRPGASADVTPDTTGEPADDALNAAHGSRTGNDGQS